MTGISKAIDPKRVGISKSLITSTALCNRKGWFSENIRTDDGGRIPIVANERMSFGSALDEAILYIAQAVRSGEAYNLPMARHLGLQAAMEREHDPAIDWGLMSMEIEVALQLFEVDILRNDGLGDPPRVNFAGALLQGINGDSIRVEHPEFGTLIGTPDFIISGKTRPEGRDLVLDLKTSARLKSGASTPTNRSGRHASTFSASAERILSRRGSAASTST